DLLVEVVEGSGGRARTVQLDRLLREVGSNVRPVRDTTVGSPDAGELVDGQVIDEVVLGRDDNRDAVVGHIEPVPWNTVLLCQRGFFFLDLARCIGDCDLTVREALEAAARTGDAVRNPNVRRNERELFDSRFSQGPKGRRAI